MAFRVICLMGLLLFGWSVAYGQPEKRKAHEEWKKQKQMEIEARKKARKLKKKTGKKPSRNPSTVVPKTKETKTKETKSSETITIADANAIVREAKRHLGTKYSAGGARPSSGFDCSGFTYYVYQQVTGKNLPRRSADQYKLGSKVSLQKASPGDLIFFSKGGNIDHVGIVVSTSGNQVHMIHASSSSGIQLINVETSEYWRKRFKGIKSM